MKSQTGDRDQTVLRHLGEDEGWWMDFLKEHVGKRPAA